MGSEAFQCGRAGKRRAGNSAQHRRAPIVKACARGFDRHPGPEAVHTRPLRLSIHAAARQYCPYMPKTAIQVRVTDEQRDAIRARAKHAGLSLSDYVRRQALGDSPAASSAPVLPAGDLEARIAARARQLYAKGATQRQAETQARRELAGGQQ